MLFATNKASRKTKKERQQQTKKLRPMLLLVADGTGRNMKEKEEAADMRLKIRLLLTVRVFVRC